MTGAIERYIRAHRRLIVGLLAAGGLNLLVYFAGITINARADGLQSAAAAQRKNVATAFDAYARKALEARLLETARERVRDLRTETLQVTNLRYPAVDVKVKELQKASGWTGHSLSYSWSELPAEALRKFTVTFRLKGDYRTLRRFVAAVEEAETGDGHDFFFIIEAIRLADSTDTGRELNLTVRLATYFHDPELERKLNKKTTATPGEGGSKPTRTRRARGAGRES